MDFIFKYICVFTLLPLISIDSNGQYRFVNYDDTNGLPISGINKIAEDSLGILWLGSNQGVANFDGLEFQLLEPNLNSPSEVISTEVSDIQVDQSGKVWISYHDGGIASFDHKSGKYLFRKYDPEDGDQFPEHAIIRMYIDPSGEYLWLISDREGIFRVNLASLESEKIIKKSRHFGIVRDDQDADIYYIAALSLYKYNIQSGELIEMSPNRYHGITMKDGYIYGRAWSHYIHVFNLQTSEELKYSTDYIHINKDYFVQGDKYWLGHYEGIQVFDLATGNYKIIENNTLEPQRLANSHILSLCKDSDENIWIGTEDGLSVIVPEYQYLQKLASTEDLRLNGLCPSGQENVVYATSLYDNLIVKVDLLNDISTSLDLSLLHQAFGPLIIQTVDDNHWVMGFNGFGVFTDYDNRVKPYEIPVLDKWLNARGTGDMVKDNYNNLWFCKSGYNQLMKYSPTSGEAVSYTVSDILPGQILKNLYWDGQHLWLGSDGGILLFDDKTQRVKRPVITGDTMHILDGMIEGVYSDLDGYLWILSLEKGLWKCQYDTNRDELKVIRGYFKKDGLQNNRPRSIAIGQNGRIFIGSIAGMAMYNPSNDLFNSLGKEYGFPINEVDIQSIGNKLFVMSRGLYYFDLHDFPFPSGVPEVIIDRVKVLGPEKGIIPDSQDMTLNYDENNLEINFRSISLIHAKDIKYKYRIDVNDPWHMVDHKTRNAYYNQLRPGKYRFEVSAAGKENVWGPKSSFSFGISPPFWQTLWFRISMLLALGGIIYSIIKYREKQIRLISGMETKMAELESEALRSQMNPHFIFNSLNSIKSFIIHNKREEAADYLTVFADLIRAVLRNSKERYITLAEEIEALELYAEIENIRLEDKFTLDWKIDKSVNIHETNIPPLTLQPFVENAIWHGFVHKEGKGKLSITIDKKSNQLVMKIRDDGVGRVKSKELEKKHSRSRSYGIAITKQRLGLKDAASNLEINDLYNKNGEAAGTEVILKIPIHINENTAN